MKINRRQRRSAATDDSLDETDDEGLDPRDDSDAVLDNLDLDDDDADGPDDDHPDDDDTDDLDGGDLDRPLTTRSRRGATTLAEAPPARPQAPRPQAPGTTRTTPRQFLHEVNVEMRKVAWPTRKETFNYASVVLVTLAVLMAAIFGLDYVFNQLSIALFG